MWQAMALSAAQSAFGAIQGNQAAVENYKTGLRANQAENLAIQEANLQNTIRTGYRVGILNVQRGQSKLQAVQQGRDVGIKARQMLGSAEANAAASGTVGASIDAVADDIDRKTDEAQGNVDANWAATQQNFDTQLESIVQNGIDSVQSARKMDYSGPKTTDILSAALGGAAKTGAEFYTEYASAQMKLGLGTKGVSTANTSPGLTYAGQSATGPVGSSNIFSLGYK